MLLNEDTVAKQLSHLADREDMLFKHQSSIKTWTVTVWVAVLAAIVTQRVTLTWPVALFALSSPILLFWFLDGVHGGIRLLFVEHARELEARIAKKNYEFAEPSDIFVLSKYQERRFPQKFRAFLHALFFAETNTVFYLGLLVATCIAIKVFVP